MSIYLTQAKEKLESLINNYEQRFNNNDYNLLLKITTHCINKNIATSLVNQTEVDVIKTIQVCNYAKEVAELISAQKSCLQTLEECTNKSDLDIFPCFRSEMKCITTIMQEYNIIMEDSYMLDQVGLVI